MTDLPGPRLPDTITAPRIAARARALPYGLGKSLRATAGPDTIDLGIGLPGYPEPPADLVEAAMARLREGDHQYEETCGSLSARTSVAAECSVPADPDTELTITNGGTEALAVALLTFVDPGDEVVVFEPFYTNFLSAIALCGATPRFVRMRPPDWSFDPGELAAAFNERTRAIIVNTPHNPSGKVYTPDELSLVGELCERWNVPLIADEVYSKYVYEGVFTSPGELDAYAHRVVSIGSLSKTHSISGWRLGFFRAPAPLTASIRRVHETITGGTATPLQNALALSGVYEEGWDGGASMRLLRDEAVAAFTEAGLDCFTPHGSCYFLADAGGPGRAYAEHLFTETGVIIAPGDLFYAGDGGATQIRVAFNKAPKTIADARERLQRFVRA